MQKRLRLKKARLSDHDGATKTRGGREIKEGGIRGWGGRSPFLLTPPFFHLFPAWKEESGSETRTQTTPHGHLSINVAVSKFFLTRVEDGSAPCWERVLLYVLQLGGASPF